MVLQQMHLHIPLLHLGPGHCSACWPNHASCMRNMQCAICNKDLATSEILSCSRWSRSERILFSTRRSLCKRPWARSRSRRAWLGLPPPLFRRPPSQGGSSRCMEPSMHVNIHRMNCQSQYAGAFAAVKHQWPARLRALLSTNLAPKQYQQLAQPSGFRSHYAHWHKTSFPANITSCAQDFPPCPPVPLRKGCWWRLQAPSCSHIHQVASISCTTPVASWSICSCSTNPIHCGSCAWAQGMVYHAFTGRYASHVWSSTCLRNEFVDS